MYINTDAQHKHSGALPCKLFFLYPKNARSNFGLFKKIEKSIFGEFDDRITLDNNKDILLSKDSHWLSCSLPHNKKSSLPSW